MHWIYPGNLGFVDGALQCSVANAGPLSIGYSVQIGGCLWNGGFSGNPGLNLVLSEDRALGLTVKLIGAGAGTLAQYQYDAGANHTPMCDSPVTLTLLTDYGQCGAMPASITMTPDGQYVCACCPLSHVPDTLHAVISDAGGCAVVDGLTFPIHIAEGVQGGYGCDGWVGIPFPQCGGFVEPAFKLRCKNSQWTLSCGEFAGGTPKTYHPDSVSCTPFALVFKGVTNFCGCPVGTVNVTIIL